MSGKKAVYFINTDRDFGYVSCHVWDILEEEGFFTEKAGFSFDGQEVMKHTDVSAQSKTHRPPHLYVS